MCCAFNGGRGLSAKQTGNSEFKMQAAMEITAKYCRKEMEDYGMCVASNPSSWQQDCYQLKVKVAHCTSSHPVIQKIRSDCSEPFSAFEQCLKLNQTSVGNCSEHISKFLACAETVKLSSLGEPVAVPHV
ncbi:coiled-coil-helix-coiled-coil-helix domain-containing protein 5-like [Huso huso]|uniref:Coiled-coil-helix-coiled-coil-helix domain-containing protein 5-like n=3 Tax=Acipenseridae TaxID=7900 RepID=A0ABR0Y8B6_HUSHU